MIIVARKSDWSGITRSMELPITEQQCYLWASRQRLIQDAFPQLSTAEREFLITGMTKEEWGEAFSEEIPEEDEE